jgi:hypothetical protein
MRMSAASRHPRPVLARQIHHLALDRVGRRAALHRQEADIDEMPLDDVADLCLNAEAMADIRVRPPCARIGLVMSRNSRAACAI